MEINGECIAKARWFHCTMSTTNGAHQRCKTNAGSVKVRRKKSTLVTASKHRYVLRSGRKLTHWTIVKTKPSIYKTLLTQIILISNKNEDKVCNIARKIIDAYSASRTIIGNSAAV